jgi:hypothetical protein
MCPSSVGTVNESSLHAEIKEWYGQAGDKFETNVGGYIIDIVRGDLLIEIQASHFHSIKKKLARLLPNYPVRLVYPIAAHKWISRYRSDMGVLLQRRKSPKRGRIEDLFTELRYMPAIPIIPNFSIEILLIDQEDIWIDDGRGSWRNKYWSLFDRKLLQVHSKKLLSSAKDYIHLLPDPLPNPFTSLDVANQAKISRKIAVNMLYCLLQMKKISVVGTKGRSRSYSIIESD